MVTQVASLPLSIEESGNLCVVIAGIIMMPRWPADSAAFQLMVGTKQTVFQFAKHNAGATAFFENSPEQTYWLDDVRCTGDEEYLFQCAHSGIGRGTCKSNKTAGVNCQSECIKECKNRFFFMK